MRILVVGMGLIGGSICKSIKAATSHAVYGCDVQQTVLDDAIADGAIDGTGTMTDGTYDMIVLCLHQRIAIQMVQEALPKIPAGTILVDTCGLKGRMVRDLTYRCRKAGVRYVGTHPMAGREKNGYYASIPNLFQNANLIVTPVDGTDEVALDTVKELADQMGFGKIVTATPMWHDNMIAYTSQLAHVVSSSYVKDFCMDDALSFSGGSFQDMTRVATMDESMWAATRSCTFTAAISGSVPILKVI